MFQAPLEVADAKAVGSGAFGACGGAPDMVEWAESFTGGHVRPSNGGFKGVENRAPALERDAVEGWHGSYGSEASFVLVGMSGMATRANWARGNA